MLGTESGSGSQGVFVSVDSGDTWQAGNAKGDLDLASSAVSRLYIEGSKPQNIVAASINAGLLASDDHGANWARLLPDFTAHDAFINPYDGQEIFAAGARGRTAAIYKSPDRGRTWIQVYNEPTGQFSVTVLAFDRTNSQVMYAGLSSGTVLKSADGGDTWNALVSFEGRVADLAATRSMVYSLTLTSGIKRSTDSGRSWSNLSFSQSANTFNDLYADPGSESILYVAASSGLYQTQDTGTTWTKLPVPASPEIANVTAVAVNPAKKSQIFAAIRSTIYRSEDAGATWRTVQLPTNRTITDIVIDPFEPNRIYAGLR